MAWIKENSFISTVVAVMVIFLSFIAITDEKIEKYEQIEISTGDTLWSIADHYRGKMAKEQWIDEVIYENTIYGGKVAAGQKISVPVAKNSVYIAQLNEEAESVKVASGN